jgi:antitoxin ParD1/3/4
MNVSLSEEWKSFVDLSVQSGRYGNASEVIRAGLRLLQDREQNTRFERLAIEALDEGPREFVQEDFDKMRAAIQREIATRAKSPSKE